MRTSRHSVLTRDFRSLKSSLGIRYARKVRGGEKKPEGKKPRMVVDETFPQGRVGMNRAWKAAAGEGETSERRNENDGKKVELLQERER